MMEPPYNVDCRNPIRWRDNHCFDATAGTEYDWMQFYWNVTNVGMDTITINDLFSIYVGACSPGYCEPGDNVTWSALDNAAVGWLGVANPKYLKFADSGDTFGVDEDL